MTRQFHRNVPLLCALLLIARSSDASQQFIGGSIVLSSQAEGEVQPSLPSNLPLNGIGGTSVGVGLVGGAFLTERVGFQIELTIPRRFEAVQNFPSFEHHVSHREIVLSPAVRVRTARALDIIAGISWVLESNLTRSAARSFLTGDLGPLSVRQRL